MLDGRKKNMKKTKEDKEPKNEQELNKKTTSNKETSNIKNNIIEILPYVIIVLIVVLIRTFLFTPIKVNGTSMVDTLHNGDTMILNKIGVKVTDIKRFQIVVIKTSDSYLIKRVIGLPGETIKYNNGKLYINGKVIKDKYCKNKQASQQEPVVQISILSQKINKGVADYGIDMYIIACIVLLDAMRYIRYSPVSESLTLVKFISVNEDLINKVDEELKKRNSTYDDNNDAILYIDSLFNNANNAEDGSSIKENS